MNFIGKKLIVIIMASVIFLPFLVGSDTKSAKIVGLLQVRDEASIIEQCLRALAVYTDAIVVLDDASQDSTVEIVELLASTLTIERIVINKESAWEKGTERDNLQRLLNEGRAIGGTHFIFLNADEIFVSTCAKDDWLRKKILSLPSGYSMSVPMANVWNGTSHYRDDERCSPMYWKWREIDCIWCDDGQMNYENNISWTSSKTLHISRMPSNYKGVVRVYDINCGLIHFKCANLDNLKLKKIWYTMLEYIRLRDIYSDFKKECVRCANKFYEYEFSGIEGNERDILLREVPHSWYEGYDFFDSSCYMVEIAEKKRDIIRWLEQYGVEYFEYLDIWNLDWLRAFREEKMSVDNYGDQL